MELFDFNQISVQDMLLVKAIAEHGSISQAALASGVSQPTASYRLNKLREIFSDPIFVSINRRMSPTTKGHRIIETFLVQIDLITKLAAPEIFDPKTTERSFTIIAKGVQFSAMVAMLPKLFFAQTRRAKLFTEQEKKTCRLAISAMMVSILWLYHLKVWGARGFGGWFLRLCR